MLTGNVYIVSWGCNCTSGFEYIVCTCWIILCFSFLCCASWYIMRSVNCILSKSLFESKDPTFKCFEQLRLEGKFGSVMPTQLFCGTIRFYTHCLLLKLCSAKCWSEHHQCSSNHCQHSYCELGSSTPWSGSGYCHFLLHSVQTHK